MMYLLCIAIILYPVTCFAYIGPGMGAGTIGVILGIFNVVLLILLAILWYPFKRLYKKFKKNKTGAAKVDNDLDP